MPLMPVRLVLGLHNHQPVGNFGSVFEQNYRDSYLPFLELMEQYPELAFTLHTSGCLLEWIVAHRPEYIERLRQLVARGQVEILGGAFYEPILSMLPRRDRLGQIRSYTAYLQSLLGCKVRGMWLAERVWEPDLVRDLAEAGMEYTLLDDYHFKQAGLDEHQLHGYYLTEDEGYLLKVFPISEPMRYLVPWKNPEDALAYLGELNALQSGQLAPRVGGTEQLAERVAHNHDPVVVCADDGEKFGGWPETHKHCFTNGWLRRFFDLLRQNQHWLKFCTLSRAMDETPAAGTIYLPDCSYREMTEWALPTPRLRAYNQLVKSLEGDPRAGEIKRFLRGGFWRNFKAKYPELQEMYARMLQASRRVHLMGEEEKQGPLSKARQELYRGQCNCAYWHGAFGGLYLPHLRNAVYHHLIAAENALLHGRSETVPLVDAEVRDFNLDAQPEVRLETLALAAYFNPHCGGSMYELDLRPIRHNLLATLSRRPEAYHDLVQQGAGQNAVSLVADAPRFKQADLHQRLHYDRYLRKSLIDHFYEPGVALSDLAANRERELGDFVQGMYDHQVKRSGRGVYVLLQRTGHVLGHMVRLAKVVSIEADSPVLTIRYTLDGLPRGQRLHFAVEFNFAGMAAGEENRYFTYDGETKAGQLQMLQDRQHAEKIGLVDEWLGLEVTLLSTRPAGFWAFPIQTVSQSEGGYELVHQSTAVLPHWLLEPDSQGHWETTLLLKLDTSRAEKRG
jgi:4-alpha-glucanotransferase